MNVTFDALRSFAVFSESMNFTRAAEQLFISQPALHVKIKQLGKELGVSLYVNRGKHLELTEEGKEVARFARETYSNVNSFVEELQGTAANQPVCLAAGQGCFMYLLDKAIQQFRKRTKQPLKLMVTDQQQTIDMLMTGQAQLGVTALAKKPQSLNARKLSDVPAMLVVPTSNEFASKKSISVTNLRDIELIVPSTGRPHRDMIDRILKMHQVNWKVAIEADGWALAIQFAKLGLGAAIVNGCCRLPAGMTGVPIRDFPGTSYYLLHQKRARLSPEQIRLRDFIMKSVK